MFAQKSRRTGKRVVYEKHVIFWARKYADNPRAQRNELVKKTMEFVKDPKKYSRATSCGAAKYIKGVQFDKNTGLMGDM